jgi:glutamate racemase
VASIVTAATGMSAPPRILLFDSGSGGLTVARAVRAALPQADLVYAADNAAFPYGNWSEARLVRRIVAVMGRLIAEARPDCVVVACNTASTLALAALREEFRQPFVGTVPAIKPAAQLTRSGVIGVLATPATVSREYTRALIHTYAYHCKVVLHGAPLLAEIAEAKLRGEAVDAGAIAAEIAPVFRRRAGNRTDVVVLGCTHYPLLIAEITAAAPWPVTFIDPAAAIARRVVSLMGQRAEAVGRPDGVAADTALFTAKRGTAPDQLAGYRAMGFAHARVIGVPI